MKRCTKCEVTKPLEEFHRDSGKKDGRQSECGLCANARAAEWSRDNPARRAYWQARDNDKRVAARYGISVEELIALRLTAAGKCNLCGRKAKLVVDHDHITGKIRGLICGSCNLGLGKLGDTLEGVMRAVEYLRRTG